LYFTLGHYDFIVISEMPDANAASVLSFVATGGGDLFALYRWKRERQQIIVGGGGRGALQSAARIGFSNQILRQSKSLRYIRQPQSPHVMNKTG